MKIPPTSLDPYYFPREILSTFDDFVSFLDEYLDPDLEHLLPTEDFGIWEKYFNSSECKQQRKLASDNVPKRIKDWPLRKAVATACSLASQDRVYSCEPATYAKLFRSEEIDENIRKIAEKKQEDEKQRIIQAREAVGYFVASHLKEGKHSELIRIIKSIQQSEEGLESFGNETDVTNIFWTFMECVREQGEFPDRDTLHKAIPVSKEAERPHAETVGTIATGLGFFVPQKLLQNAPKK